MGICGVRPSFFVVQMYGLSLNCLNTHFKEGSHFKDVSLE